MADHALTALLLPLFATLLIVAWLFWLTRGGRPVHLKIRGLGIEVNIDNDSSHEASVAAKEE